MHVPTYGKFFSHLASVKMRESSWLVWRTPIGPNQWYRLPSMGISYLDAQGIPVVVVAWLLPYSEDLSHSWSSSCLIDAVAAYNTLQHTNCFALAHHRYTSWPRCISFAHAQCSRITISACPPYKCINPYC